MTWNFRAFLLGLGLLAMVFGFMAQAHAGDVTVRWELATTYEDDEPLPAEEISAHRVEWSKCETNDAFGAKEGEVTVPMPSQSAIVARLTAGRYCFRAYTIATNSLESEPSNVVAKRVTGRPGRPIVIVL